MFNITQYFKEININDIEKIHIENAYVLIENVNLFCKKLEEVYKIVFTYENFPTNTGQGYRMPSVKYGASASAHKVGMALDIPNKIVSNLPLGYNKIAELPNIEKFLIECNLYMEDASYTPFHTHLQIRKSTRRIFKPY
jgi:hypothetical protein